MTLLHPPYTLWHLSYVVIGAGLAPRLDYWVLGLTLAAFLLALGVGAHALDELQGRPLRTRIGSGMLVALAVASIGGAIGIGVAVSVMRDLWLLAFVACGGFLVVAYNLELFGGRFHGDWWFAASWGGFPTLTGYFACAERIRAEAVAAALFATFSSLAQRHLSTQVRTVRRRAESVTGTIRFADGSMLRVARARPSVRSRLSRRRSSRWQSRSCFGTSGSSLRAWTGRSCFRSASPRG